jgi:hypothetical protein
MLVENNLIITSNVGKCLKQCHLNEFHRMYVYVCVCVCVCMRAHARTRARAHTHTHTHSDTSTNSSESIFLGNTVVTHLVKNFPAFYGTKRFTTLLTRTCHWTVSQARGIQSIPSHPVNDTF